MSEIIVKMDKHIKIKGGSYVQDLVRCRDCKWWQDNNGGYPTSDCRWGKEETPDADDYCSYGERAEQ